MKNKLLSIILSAICLVLCLSACSNTAKYSDEPFGIHHAVITFKDYGEVHLELDGDTAPITVRNFVKLANDGFYDGLTIHRISAGFVIQGGDPNADGTGGSKTNIKGEFSQNGVENNIIHEKGVISMARLGNDFDSANSQFFIVLNKAESLDGGYAGFGHVTEGMEIIEKIAKETPVADSISGFVAKENQPIIESIKITD